MAPRKLSKDPRAVARREGFGHARQLAEARLASERTTALLDQAAAVSEERGSVRCRRLAVEQLRAFSRGLRREAELAEGAARAIEIA